MPPSYSLNIVRDEHNVRIFEIFVPHFLSEECSLRALNRIPFYTTPKYNTTVRFFNGVDIKMHIRVMTIYM